MLAAKIIKEGAMNNYYQLAALYFQRFESAEFFPKRSDIRVLFFVLFAAVFLVLAYLLFATDWHFTPAWLMYVALYGSEGMAILAAYAILNHKQKAMIANLPADESQDDDQKIRQARQTALVEITGRPPSEFLDLLQDIKKLKELEQQHRSQLDPEFWKSLWAFLTHPFWPKVLSGLFVVASVLFGAPEKLLSINLSEIFNNKQTIATLWKLLQLLAGSALLAFVFYLLTRQLLELGRILISIRWPSKQGNTTTLNYFMRDLIKYYAPEKKAPPTPPATECPTQPQAQVPIKPKPSNGLLIAALAIQAAYTAWQSTKRKQPR